MQDLSGNSVSFDLFSQSRDNMIATNQSIERNPWERGYRIRLRDYQPDEIEKIINGGVLREQVKLSRNYFYKDGFYRKIILHYATLLKYVGLLIPNPGQGKKLSTPHITKKYQAGVDFMERIDTKSFLTNCMLRALVDGCYYGVITNLNKDTFAYLDLPSAYCCTNYKDQQNNDLIDFDVRYFDTILNTAVKEQILEIYPKEISKYYRAWKKGKKLTHWMTISNEIGMCFPMFDARPLFLNVIPATIDYETAIDTEQQRDLEEIRKIIIQKIPHTNDGRLVFEPNEAEVIHSGTVGMMKGNKNVSVLTTYADVEVASSRTATETQNTTLERMLQNVYANAGVSGEVFASKGSNTLESSLDNDLALVMTMANKFSNFLTNIVNRVYGNSNITFKYTILPISYYNVDKYIGTAFKLASSGYSLLLPALAMDLSQKDLGNVKDLENDVLELGEKLRPLASAYTQGNTGAEGSEGGRPKKSNEEKAEQTVKNETSKDNVAKKS